MSQWRPPASSRPSTSRTAARAGGRLQCGGETTAHGCLSPLRSRCAAPRHWPPCRQSRSASGADTTRLRARDGVMGVGSVVVEVARRIGEGRGGRAIEGTAHRRAGIGVGDLPMAARAQLGVDEPGGGGGNQGEGDCEGRQCAGASHSEHYIAETKRSPCNRFQFRKSAQSFDNVHPSTLCPLRHREGKYAPFQRRGPCQFPRCILCVRSSCATRSATPSEPSPIRPAASFPMPR